MIVQDPRAIKNLVYFFLLVNGMPGARQVYEAWRRDPVLKEYESVPLGQLEAWRNEFMEEGVTP